MNKGETIAQMRKRHEREIQRMDKVLLHKYALSWPRRDGIRPLFHEQRRKDEVFGEDV